MLGRGSESTGWPLLEHLLKTKLCSKGPPESPGMEDVTVPATEQLAL